MNYILNYSPHDFREIILLQNGFNKIQTRKHFRSSNKSSNKESLLRFTYNIYPAKIETTKKLIIALRKDGFFLPNFTEDLSPRKVVQNKCNAEQTAQC